MKPIVLLLLLIISVYAWQQEAECPAALPHVCEDEIGPSCVNFESDFQHCGECDHKCKDNETCVKGECACTCSNAINARTCPNANSACGSSSINCTTTPLTPDCINGACACRNTNTACLSVGCTPCPTPQVCDATGVCSCCKVTDGHLCTPCLPSQAGCNGNSGACCLLNNNACTSSAVCCGFCDTTLAKCVSCIPSGHTGCTATTDCCTGLGLSCIGGVCTT